MNRNLETFLVCLLCGFVSGTIIGTAHLSAIPAVILTAASVALGLKLVEARRSGISEIPGSISRGLVPERSPRAPALQGKSGPATGSGAPAQSSGSSPRDPQPEAGPASTWRKGGASIKLDIAKDGAVTVIADGLSIQQFNGGRTYGPGLRRNLESISGIKWNQNTKDGKRRRVMAGKIAPGSDQPSVVDALKKAIGATTL